MQAEFYGVDQKLEWNDVKKKLNEMIAEMILNSISSTYIHLKDKFFLNNVHNFALKKYKQIKNFLEVHINEMSLK